MKDFLDILKELIPTVIIIAGFLLPVFLKKQKEEAKRRASSGPGGSAERKKAAGSVLEDKVRRYFEEMKREKMAGAEPKPAFPNTPEAPSTSPTAKAPSSAQPPRPTVVEPAVPVRRKKTPLPQKGQRPGGIEEMRPQDISSLKEASRGDADNAYSLNEEAYGTPKNAYAVDEEVYRSGFEDVHGAGEIELSSYKKGEYPSLMKETSALGGDKGLASPSAAPASEEPLFPVSLSRLDLQKAVIFKEILERPVGIHGFITDSLW